jgi:hypothetical protein
LVSTSVVPFNNSPNTVVNNGVSLSLNLSKTISTGTAEQLTTPSVSTFAIAAYTNYTIECWIYITALTANPNIYSLGTGGAAAWQNLAITGAGAIYWQFGGGSWGWSANFGSPNGIILRW